MRPEFDKVVLLIAVFFVVAMWIFPRGRRQKRLVLKKIIVLALALAAFAPVASAQNFPDRVITLVSPFPPGGPSDTTARMIVGPMSKVLGQQIIVENVSGAGGTIGSNRVAKAKPDGYTITVSGSGTHAAAEFLNKDLPYRSTDFEQIGLVNHFAGGVGRRARAYRPIR